MHDTRRNKKDLPRLQGDCRLSVQLVFDGSFEDVDDLLARMPVAGEGGAGSEVDPQLVDFAPGYAEVVALEIDAGRAWGPRLLGLQRSGAEQHGRGHEDSSLQRHARLLTEPI
jgi:hypothetical protein